jgi:hypothetical protein
MTKHITSLLAPFAFTACVAGPGAPSSTSSAQDVDREECPDNVPASLAPAADQDLAFTLDASGVQIYSCNGTAWTFVAPDADLYLPSNDGEIKGHHFAGPTWEYVDGSYVVGKKLAAASVDPASIPWLLLVATSHGGPDGRMTPITAVQRLSTSGGLAPATGCDANHVGVSADVPYTATYYFYVPRDPSKPNNQRCGA